MQVRSYGFIAQYPLIDFISLSTGQSFHYSQNCMRNPFLLPNLPMFPLWHYILILFGSVTSLQGYWLSWCLKLPGMLFPPSLHWLSFLPQIFFLEYLCIYIYCFPSSLCSKSHLSESEYWSLFLKLQLLSSNHYHSLAFLTSIILFIFHFPTICNLLIY